MRPTTLIGLAGLIVVGVIGADLIQNPKGTAAAGNVVNTFWGTSISGLLGGKQVRGRK
jgi:hypothetical protein